jgi:hypothetical protein
MISGVVKAGALFACLEPLSFADRSFIETWEPSHGLLRTLSVDV